MLQIIVHGRLVWILLLLSFSSINCSLSLRRHTEDGTEEWGYVPVRPGASMFYWFYKTTHPDGYLNRPIVLWLQGGPGLSGTGLGNFLQIGPLDQDMKPRNTTWIQTVNLLFVDCPVGSGFSIAEDYLNITAEASAADLINLLQVFMNEHPVFAKTPLYIFGQSYGGSLGVTLAYYLNEAIVKNEIECNLQAVAIGNACISTAESIVNASPLLFHTSLLDYAGYIEADKHVQPIYEKLKMQDYSGMFLAETNLYKHLYKHINCFNFYNIFLYPPSDAITNMSEIEKHIFCSRFNTIYSMNIENLMNGIVREKLQIIPLEKMWGLRLIASEDDLYKSRDHIVDKLLLNTNIDVIVYQGQLDFICNTAGAIAWIQNLTWPGLKEYNKAIRTTMVNPDTSIPEMFVKSYGHFKMYWVLKAGHTVPSDVPDAALRMLNHIINNEHH